MIPYKFHKLEVLKNLFLKSLLKDLSNILLFENMHNKLLEPKNIQFI